MERGRNAAQGARDRRRGRCIGVAFQAGKPYFLARQHARIRRTMRLVARRAALEPHRRVLENKRPALVAVAPETTRFVSGDCLDRPRQLRAVRVVAVDARHRPFGQLVLVRPLEARPDCGMALRALGVDGRHLPRPQFFGRFVHRMAGNATHLIARVRALNAANVRGLIEVAGETNAVGLSPGRVSPDSGCRQLRCSRCVCYPGRGRIRRLASPNRASYPSQRRNVDSCGNPYRCLRDTSGRLRTLRKLRQPPAWLPEPAFGKPAL